MKLDMDLVREILIFLEKKNDRSICDKINLNIGDYTYEKIAYHLCRMAERNLIVYEASTSTTNPIRLIEVFPFELTWEGHEFLATAYSNTNWQQAKKRVADVTGAISFDLMKAVLIEMAKEHLGLKS